MNIMNSFVNDIFERIASEASKLTSYNNVDLGLNCIKTHYNFNLLITLEVLKGCRKKNFGHFQQKSRSLWKIIGNITLAVTGTFFKILVMTS